MIYAQFSGIRELGIIQNKCNTRRYQRPSDRHRLDIDPTRKCGIDVLSISIRWDFLSGLLLTDHAWWFISQATHWSSKPLYQCKSSFNPRLPSARRVLSSVIASVRPSVRHEKGSRSNSIRISAISLNFLWDDAQYHGSGSRDAVTALTL